MSFQPVVISSGLVGWQFLKSTQETQRAAFDAAPLLTRDTAYFESKIGEVTSAEQLVADRRLLRVALGAFGLQDDINNKFFIEKILDEGLSDPQSLANKLADERYKSLARSFAFDDPAGPRTGTEGFAADIVSRFRAQEFEIAVGNQNADIRLAMNFERSLPEIAGSVSSDETKWFRIMGTPPIRTVLEKALGLPSSFGRLDIDQQLEVFRDKARSRFDIGDVSEMADPAVMERVVQTFLLQAQASEFAQSSNGQVALTLLQSIPRQSILGGPA